MEPIEFTLSSERPVFPTEEQSRQGIVISSGYLQKMILKILMRKGAVPTVLVNMISPTQPAHSITIYGREMGKPINIPSDRNLVFTLIQFNGLVEYDFELTFK